MRTEDDKKGYKGPLFYANRGDLVISKIRVAQGSLCVVPESLDHLAVSAEYPVYIVDNAKVSADFVRLVIRTRAFKHRVSRLRSGNTTKARIRPADFEKLKIPLPSLPQQRALQDAYSDALAKAAKLAAESDLIAQAGQKAFEHALGVAPLIGMPDRPAFIGRFKDIERWSHESMLRAIAQPAHAENKWPLRALGELIEDIENGWSPQCLDHPAEAERWGVLKVGAVSFGYFNEAENKELPPTLKPRPYYEVKPGDVIISRANVTRYVGACAHVESTRPMLMLSDKLFRVRFQNNGNLDGRFLAAVMRLPTVREQVETRLTGTSPTMKNISKPALLDLKFPTPDLETQRVLVKELDAAQRSAQALSASAQLLRSNAWDAFERALFDDNCESTETPPG